MRKRNKKKKGPDYLLAIEQIEGLNKEFYDNYFEKYFNVKLILLLTIICKTDEFVDLFDKETKELELGVLKIGINKENYAREDIVIYGKFELSILYYHVLETFLRLFLAHVQFKNSPWIEIARNRNPRKFKETLRDLSKGNYRFSFRNWSTDEILMYIFYGVKNIEDMSAVPENINKDIPIKLLKEWIEWAASNTLEVFDYNSYKHGLAVFAGERGVQYGDPGDIKFKEKGESLLYISSYEKPDRWVWRKNVIFAPLDARATIINIVLGLISNIIKVGRHTYLGETIDSLMFIGGEKAIPSHFHKEAKTKNKFGFMLESYSIELSYYKK